MFLRPILALVLSAFAFVASASSVWATNSEQPRPFYVSRSFDQDGDYIKVLSGIVDQIPSVLYGSAHFKTDLFMMLTQVGAMLSDPRFEGLVDTQGLLEIQTVPVYKSSLDPTNRVKVTKYDAEALARVSDGINFSIGGARGYIGRGWQATIDKLKRDMSPEGQIDGQRRMDVRQFRGIVTGLILSARDAQNSEQRRALFREFDQKLRLSVTGEPQSITTFLKDRLKNADPQKFRGILPKETVLLDGLSSYQIFAALALALPIAFDSNRQPVFTQHAPERLLELYSDLYKAHLSPIIPEELRSLVNEMIENFAVEPLKQTQFHEEEEAVSFPGELVLVPKAYALLRGYVGDDCATQFSSLFAMSKYEHVYFVRNRGEYTGYLSATLVEVEGKPTLYFHTLQGEIRATHVPAILAAARSALVEHLGLDQGTQVLLPEDARLTSLINNSVLHVTIRSMASQGRRVAIKYFDGGLRQSLTELPYSQHAYDVPSNNTHGHLVGLPSAPINRVNFATTEDAPELASHQKALLAYLNLRVGGGPDSQDYQERLDRILRQARLSHDEFAVQTAWLAEDVPESFAEFWELMTSPLEQFPVYFQLRNRADITGSMSATLINWIRASEVAPRADIKDLAALVRELKRKDVFKVPYVAEMATDQQRLQFGRDWVRDMQFWLLLYKNSPENQKGLLPNINKIYLQKLKHFKMPEILQVTWHLRGLAIEDETDASFGLVFEDLNTAVLNYIADSGESEANYGAVFAVLSILIGHEQSHVLLPALKAVIERLDWRLDHIDWAVGLVKNMSVHLHNKDFREVESTVIARLQGLDQQDLYRALSKTAIDEQGWSERAGKIFVLRKFFEESSKSVPRQMGELVAVIAHQHAEKYASSEFTTYQSTLATMLWEISTQDLEFGRSVLRELISDETRAVKGVLHRLISNDQRVANHRFDNPSVSSQVLLFLAAGFTEHQISHFAEVEPRNYQKVNLPGFSEHALVELSHDSFSFEHKLTFEVLLRLINKPRPRKGVINYAFVALAQTARILENGRFQMDKPGMNLVMAVAERLNAVESRNSNTDSYSKVRADRLLRRLRKGFCKRNLQ